MGEFVTELYILYYIVFIVDLPLVVFIVDVLSVVFNDNFTDSVSDVDLLGNWVFDLLGNLKGVSDKIVAEEVETIDVDKIIFVVFPVFNCIVENQLVVSFVDVSVVLLTGDILVVIWSVDFLSDIFLVEILVVLVVDIFVIL